MKPRKKQSHVARKLKQLDAEELEKYPIHAYGTKKYPSPSERALYFNEIKYQQLQAAKLKEGKILAKDGVWLVPVEERMKGWEKYGFKESDATSS